MGAMRPGNQIQRAGSLIAIDRRRDDAQCVDSEGPACTRNLRLAPIELTVVAAVENFRRASCRVKVYSSSSRSASLPMVAGQLVRGTGYGLINDLVIGVIGAFIGGWLLPQLNIHLGAGMIAAIINATIGAVLLLVVLRFVRGGGRWGSRWGWRR